MLGVKRALGAMYDIGGGYGWCYVDKRPFPHSLSPDWTSARAILPLLPPLSTIPLMVRPVALSMNDAAKG